MIKLIYCNGEFLVDGKLPGELRECRTVDVEVKFKSPYLKLWSMNLPGEVVSFFNDSYGCDFTNGVISDAESESRVLTPGGDAQSVLSKVLMRLS